MRPVTLTIQAFGPYCTPTTIDFSRLGSSGVFLIRGATGSGKTMIFDAMSYALFGRGTFGGRAEAKNRSVTLRCNFAPSNLPTQVTLVFEHQNHRYQVIRGMKPSGQPFASLAEDGQVLQESPGEVNKRVQEILGIDYSQFKLIGMLAQGSFREFLYAKSSEKAELFAKIFPQELAHAVQGAVVRDCKAAEKTCSHLLDQYQRHLSQAYSILEDCKEHDAFEPFAPPSALEQAQTNVEDAAAKLNDKTASMQKTSAKLGQHVQKLKEELDALRKRHQRLKDLLDIQEDREVKKQEFSRADQSFSQADARFSQRRSDLERELQTNEEMACALDGIDRLEDECSKLKLEVKKAKDYYQERTQDMDSIEAHIVQMIDERSALVKLGGREQELRNNLQQTIEQRNCVVGMQEACSHLLKDACSDTQDYYDRLRQQVQTLGLKVTQNQRECNQIKERVTKEVKLRDQRAEVSANIDLLRRISSLGQQLTSNIERLTQLKQGVIEAERLEDQARNNLQHLEQKQHNNLRAALAQELVAGKPCPVCGSVHHPQVYRSERGEELGAEQLNKAKGALENAAKSLHAAQANLNAHQESCRHHCNEYRQAFEEMQRRGLCADAPTIVGEILDHSNEVDQLFNVSLNQCQSYVSIVHDKLKRSFEEIEDELSGVEDDKKQLQKAEQTLADMIKEHEGARSELEKEAIALGAYREAVSAHRKAFEQAVQKAHELEVLMDVFWEIPGLSERAREAFGRTAFTSLSAANHLELATLVMDNEAMLQHAHECVSACAQQLKNQREQTQHDLTECEQASSQANHLQMQIDQAYNKQRSCQQEKEHAYKDLLKLQSSLGQLEEKLIEERAAVGEVTREQLNVQRQLLRAEEQELTQTRRTAQEHRDDAYQKLVRVQAQHAALCEQLGLSTEVQMDPSVLHDVEKERETAQEAMNQADQKQRELSGQINRLLEQKGALGQEVRNLNEVASSYTDSHRQYLMLHELVKAAQGGASKVPFTSYLLGQHFERIVRRANRHLDVMTNGRLQLRRAKEQNSTGYQGFELAVWDRYSGQATERGVNTLSGGETFEASLALALGLSEMVQEQVAGISFETLFIDEGFGTLDASTLRRVMRVLTDLGQGKLLVGVISHVDALAESIPQQIVVERDDRQGAKVEIVGDYPAQTDSDAVLVYHNKDQ